jgi:glycosyltransferase involved in cell wall biosynthesis
VAADPLVSVVVPVRDGDRHLDEALQSIAEQTFAPFEVVVVDDGSRDTSAAIARRWGARVEPQPRLGQSAARNRGVESSSGDLVAFLDADDVWLPDKLERQVGTLAAHLHVDVLFGHVRQFRSRDAPGAPQRGVLFSTMVARRGALEAVGPFAIEWRVGELMEWLMRAREAGLRELVSSDVVSLRRLHASNVGRARDARVDHARILRAAIKRKRQPR